MKTRRLSRLLSLLTVFVLLLSTFTFTLAEKTAPDKPVIGISWAYDEQAEEYAYYKAIIEEAGGIAVELPQITCAAVEYDEKGDVKAEFLEKSGMLKQEYADIVKSRDFGLTNVASALDGIDGVFFTGGEDVSPSLFAVPQKEANKGEAINATRDISDYVLMAYCMTIDIPTFGVCRGEQVLGIVAGSDFIQDIPDYYAAQNVTYADTHRMPVDAPNRDYARHDVDVIEQESHLYKIVGGTSFKNISSWHHQAVGSVEGTDLIVTATSTYDGVTIIEGIELKTATYCVGVQGHPENDCGLVLVDKATTPCDYDICMKFFTTLVEQAALYSQRPTIGISWKSPIQNYDSIKTVIRVAGGKPVEVPQVICTEVTYDADNKVAADCLEASGMLKQDYADIVKSKDFSLSNVEEAFAGLDGMFFTGGEDVSPSLFRVAQSEANAGEGINATRDISDYLSMAYCMAKDIPAFGVCRGEQVMAIVAGAGFIQDIPNYYAQANAVYDDTHRMPPDAPGRTYARHAVNILNVDSHLRKMVGASVLDNVSSWHHQAVNAEGLNGTNLVLTASTTTEGITIAEAIELANATFCVGVQWHPENDIGLAYHRGKREAALCDLDTCLTFIKTLVEYAGK